MPSIVLDYEANLVLLIVDFMDKGWKIDEIRELTWPQITLYLEAKAFINEEQERRMKHVR